METPLIFSHSNIKSNKFNPLSTSPPHMLAFHLAWISLFSNFFSTFSIPPLLPAIRKDLNLTQNDVVNAGIAAFTGSVLSRLAMGPICDLIGPRIATAAFSIITSPAVLAASCITSSTHFIAIRFLIGFSLANFVACQFWMSSMFSSEVVGVANGVAAGWANVGSGFTQLIMPLIYSFFIHIVSLSSSSAWRIAFIVPACFQIVTAVMVLVYGQDLPSGKYERTRRQKTGEVSKTGEDSKTGENGFSILLNGLRNYRGWILGLTYGFCFGVELTVDNIIAAYFYDTFSLNIETAGAIAASFGLANVVSRPMGGVLSDALGRRFGLRGRLWGLWVVQSLAGFLCFLLGRVGSLWGSILVMCGFSFLVQAASGLTFGVVPFVSKRSLGVISGMTGSGGTLGAVVTQLLLFSGSNTTTQSSISHMGLLMIICTLPVTLLYFPQSGGMFCGPTKQPDPTDQDDYNMLE